MWNHPVLHDTWQILHSRLYPSQLKLVLDLATTEDASLHSRLYPSQLKLVLDLATTEDASLS